MGVDGGKEVCAHYMTLGVDEEKKVCAHDVGQGLEKGLKSYQGLS